MGDRLESLPEDKLLKLRESAEGMGGEGTLGLFDSIPTLPSTELLELAFGDPYWFLKERARSELSDRLAVVDSIVFAHRAQQAQNPQE